MYKTLEPNERLLREEMKQQGGYHEPGTQRMPSLPVAKPKILVISVFPPTQAPEADHAFYLCENLAAAGCRIGVLTTKGSVTAHHPNIETYKVMQDWSWRELPRLTRILKQVRPTIILLVYAGWVYQHHPMITFAPTVAKRLLPNTRFITLFDAAYGALIGDQHTRTVRAVRKVAAYLSGIKYVDYNFGTLLRDSDRILGLAEEHLQGLSKHSSRLNGKGALLPIAPLIQIQPDSDGLTRERGRVQLGVAPNEFLLSYFGYLYPGKGIETLLQAFQIAQSRSNNLRLALIGGVLDQAHQDDSQSYQNGLKNLAQQLGIADCVIWSGGYGYNDEQASMFLRASDACVLPYDNGVQRNHSSFATAVAHGLPIITTRVATTSSLFRNDENVLLCPPQNPASMAEAIHTLLTQPDLSVQLRRGALQLAEECFSWKRAVKLLLMECDVTIK